MTQKLKNMDYLRSRTSIFDEEIRRQSTIYMQDKAFTPSKKSSDVSIEVAENPAPAVITTENDEKSSFCSSEVFNIIKNEALNMSFYSSCHGLPFVSRSKLLVQTIVWWLFIFGALAACGYSLYVWIGGYLVYPVVSFKSVYTESPTLFPAVTICNLNPLTTSDALTKLNTILPPGFDINSNWTLYNEYKQKLLIQAMTYGYKERQSLGEAIADILITCKFNDYFCSYTDFSWYYSFNHGNCFTFNSGFTFNTSTPIENSTQTPVVLNMTYKPGYKNGLYLELFANNGKQNKIKNEYYGIKMFIHNQTDRPELTHAIFLNTGTLADIQVKKSFITNTPYPYNSCQDVTTNKFNKVLYNVIENTSYGYNQKDCFDLCLQQIIIKECGCYDVQYLPLDNVTTPCLSDDQLNCAKNSYCAFIVQDENQLCKEYCPLECDSAYLDFSISIDGFPSAEYYQVLLGRNITVQNYDGNVANVSRERIESDTLAVSIYFDDFMYTATLVTPKYSYVDFLSNFGGIMGVYIGVSYLSFFEFFDFMINSLMIIFCTEKKKVGQ